MRLPAVNDPGVKKVPSDGTNGFSSRYALTSTEGTRGRSCAPVRIEMNDQKAVRPGSAWRKPVGQESPVGQPPEATMQTHAAIRKAGGRLSREDQRRLRSEARRVGKGG